MHVQSVTHRCKHCGLDSPVWADDCQRCGEVLHSATRIRVLGGILLVVGLLLTGSMAYLMVWVARMIRQSDEPGTTARFTGDASDAALVYGVLGVVLAFGITSMVAGVWQLRYGRRNPSLVRIALLFALVFSVIGIAVEAFL